MKIVFVPESFPRISETFVINEVWWAVKNSGGAVSVVPHLEIFDSDCCKNYRYLDLSDGLVELNKVENKLGFFAKIKVYVNALWYGRNVWGGFRFGALKKHFFNSMSIVSHVERIMAQEPSVVITHFGYDNAVASSIVSNLLGVPHILWLHGSDIHTCLHRSFLFIYNNTDKIITNSMYSASLLEKGGQSKVTVVNPGICLDNFSISTAIGKSMEPVLISVARLGHSKNHKRLFRIFQKVLDECKTARLHLVGDGPEYTELVAYSKEIGIFNSVVFFKSVSPAEVARLLRASWVKLLFSDNEGLGVALMEAAACGLPAVASDVGGIPEVVVHGETGYLINFNGIDSEQVAADMVIKLINNQDVRLEMAYNARRRAEAVFDEKVHFKVLSEILLTLSESRKTVSVLG